MSKTEIKPRITAIARHKCSNCGEPVQVLANKNLIAYYYCHGVDTKGGEPRPCSHHEKWGRAASQRMIDRYLTKSQPPQKAAHDVKPAPDQERAPEKESEWDEYGI